MADLDWYKNTLDGLSKFVSEQLHPQYGPCDGFADGNCSECLRVLGGLKEAHERMARMAELAGVAFVTVTNGDMSRGVQHRVTAEFRSLENAQEFHRCLAEITGQTEATQDTQSVSA